MNIINKTQAFVEWVRRLRDSQATDRIASRINNAAGGNFGDHHFLRDGVWEMRIDHGPGYRLYYARDGEAVYLLLVGGIKRTQGRDIEKAAAMWKAIQEEHP